MSWRKSSELHFEIKISADYQYPQDGRGFQPPSRLPPGKLIRQKFCFSFKCFFFILRNKNVSSEKKKLLITVRRLFKECFFQTHYYFHKFLPFFQTQQNKPLCQNFFFVLSKPGGVDSPEQLRSRAIICQLSRHCFWNCQ